MRMNACHKCGASVAVLIVALAAVLGCEKSVPPQPASSETEESRGSDAQQAQSYAVQTPSKGVEEAHLPVTLRQMAADIDTQKSRVIEAFLQADWSKGDAMFAGTNLAMSEADFIRQTAQERQQLSEQNITDMAKVRELTHAVIDVGQKAADQGDRARAEKCFRAVLSLGETLSAPERMTIVQVLGKAVQSLAQKQLDALPAK